MTAMMMCPRPRQCDRDRDLDRTRVGVDNRCVCWNEMVDFWLSSRVCGVVEEEKGLGRGLEGVVFQRLAREEGRCTVWAGLIRHAARGDDGMWDVARGQEQDDADGDGGWMTDDDLVVVLDQCAHAKKIAPEPEPELKSEPEPEPAPGVCVLRLRLCWEGGWGRRREEGCAMNPCDCKRPESQGSSWRRGGPFAFPFLADQTGFLQCPGLSQFKTQRTYQDGWMPGTDPDPTAGLSTQHSALGWRILSSLVSRPFVTRVSSV